MCWSCGIGEYVTYEFSDEESVPRCGQCGEREQDDPANKKAAPRRAAAKRTKE